MTEPWTPERVVDAALARELITEQFGEQFAEPFGGELVPERVEPLGVGYDNTAYLVNGEWVFRFPRRQIAVPLIEREARFLPALAPRLPLPIPVPRWVGRPSERYPWPFAGHRLLRGRTACAGLGREARIAAAEPLARFLAALHAAPVPAELPGDEIGRMNVPLRRARAHEALAGAPAPRLRAILDEAPDDAPRPPPVVAHGDLYARHILVDDAGALAGIIDWGDLHRGDPAVDLAIAHGFLPPEARAAFRAAYGGVDDVTWALARFRAVSHALMVERFARASGDADLSREVRLVLDEA